MRVSARAIVLNGDNLLVMDRNKFGNKYVSLCGGKVKTGETPEQAVIREIKEETTLDVVNPRLVIIEEAGEVFGMHYIYLCDYKGGDVKLDPESTEYKINQLGQNIYTPMWVNKKDLPNINLLPVKLKEKLIEFLNNGFPDQPINLSAKD
jgi:8-oxo-dGTP diphosphatase